MKHCLLIFCIACVLLLAPFAVAQEEGVVERRALLVGCDRFVTQPDTTPSSANNVIRMEDTLSGGAMNMEELVTVDEVGEEEDVVAPELLVRDVPLLGGVVRGAEDILAQPLVAAGRREHAAHQVILAVRVRE